jgi:metallo-beta-lactamase family protein
LQRRHCDSRLVRARTRLLWERVQPAIQVSDRKSIAGRARSHRQAAATVPPTWCPNPLNILHHGAVNGTTGSCHRLQLDADNAILIDCGLFQGAETTGGDESTRHQIEFRLDDVRALIVTHVHIDHIGRLPYLLAAGFRGPIICTMPSATLLPLVIEDALKVGFTRDERLIKGALALIKSLTQPVDYGHWQTIIDHPTAPVHVRLQRAGHILGSAYAEIDVGIGPKSQRMVFSGDLGAPHAPLLPAPKSPQRADTVVLESTYGNRNHEDRRTRRLRLKAAIDHAMKDGGTVLVPAFSIGRTQELLYELEGLIHEAKDANWRELAVVVDSPLAARFTAAYTALKPWWDAEAHKRLRAGRHPLSFDNLITVDSHEDHLKFVDHLAKTRRPAIVLAASGMAAGGRIVNYLKAMIEDPRHDVLFVGFQAPGTPGHAIQKYGPKGGYVEFDGQSYTIRAKVSSISGYSAHAGQDDLINFVRRMPKLPREVRLVHGDHDAKRTLRDRLLAMAAAKGQPMQVTIGTEAHV